MSKNDEQIKALALELTILTGEVVTAEVTDFWQDYLHFPDGGRLSVTSPDANQLKIYATSPSEYKGPTVYDAPEIKVTASRPAADIARDIVRRLLPKAREHWQKCREAAARQLERKETVKAITDALAQYMTIRLETDETGADVYNNNARAHVYSDGSITRFEISRLTLPQALQILALLEGAQ